MVHYSAVGFLAFALCLVACLSANAVGAATEPEPPVINKVTAQKAVDEAKTSINDINDKAQIEVNKAEAVLSRVETSKRQAEEAKSKAEQALSQAEKATPDNEEAKALVENIKEISNTVSALHLNAKNKVDKTIAGLGDVLKEAEKLKNDCNKEDMLITDSTTDFQGIKSKASIMKTETDKLDPKITAAVTLMDGVDTIEKDMEQNLTQAQLATLHVIGIVAVTKIETMIGDTNSITRTIQTKKNEVNDIVQQLEELKATLPSGSTKSINALWKNTEAELTKATGAVEKAEEAQKKIKKEKELADTALKNFPTKSQVSEARTELEKVEASVENLNGIVEQLKSELLKADNYIKNAKDLNQQIKTALSTTTGKPSTEQSEKTENSASTVRQSTETDQKDTTIQPTSKELPSQSDKSTEEVKDALINSAQNVPTTALTGGKAPAPGAKNDSAMIVSVPLLVALIASAALQ